MQDPYGNYILEMASIGVYYPRGDDGGGGEGEKEVFFGSGAPAVTPEADEAIYGNILTGELHHWYDGVWH